MRKLPVSFMAILLFAGFVFSASAQDAPFKQFYANPIFFNPAMAGTAGTSRISANYLTEMAGNYQYLLTRDICVSYDQPVGDSAGGIGFVVGNSKLGFESSISASGMYAHRFNLGKSYTLSTGLEASYQQRIFNGPWANINTNNGFMDFADFSAGMELYGKNIYGGLAVAHITQPNMAFEGNTPLLPRYTASAGIMLPLNNGLATFSPNAIFQGQYHERDLYVGCSMIAEHFSIGAYSVFYMNTDNYPGSTNQYGMVLQAGYQGKHVKLCYSFSQVLEQTYPSVVFHQVSLIAEFGHYSSKIRTINCPVF